MYTRLLEVFMKLCIDSYIEKKDKIWNKGEVLGQAYFIREWRDALKYIVICFFTSIPILSLIVLLSMFHVLKITYFLGYMPLFVYSLFTLDGIKNTLFIQLFSTGNYTINWKKIALYSIKKFVSALLLSCLVFVALRYLNRPDLFFTI